MDLALLRDLSDDDRSRVIESCSRHRYRHREVIFHEGDPGDSLHMIVSGRLAVRASTPTGDTATLTILGPGQAFGELSLLDARSRRTATVTALESSETLVMSSAAFAELRRAHPSVEHVLVNALVTRVERLSALLMEALYVPVEQRVVRRLLALAHLYGDGQRTAEIPLTQEDLAGLAGASRPTVNQVLRRLEADGAVSLQRGRIHVLDAAALRQRAR